jgi:Ankyrin repeats (many copies)/Ankyrin repeat
VAARDLISLMHALGSGDTAGAHQLLAAAPELAGAQVDRDEEFFVAECHAQFYAGDTALHAASCAYDLEIARELVIAGADVSARNRRGAEPIHAAVIGAPGSSNWNPPHQVAVIAYLVESGADPNARAKGGVTPLHRAVRNRCSAAVRALLEAGADPELVNEAGSTAMALAQWTTGRSGSGSPEAKAEQAAIVQIFTTIRR